MYVRGRCYVNYSISSIFYSVVFGLYFLLSLLQQLNICFPCFVYNQSNVEFEARNKNKQRLILLSTKPSSLSSTVVPIQLSNLCLNVVNKLFLVKDSKG